MTHVFLYSVEREQLIEHPACLERHTVRIVGKDIVETVNENDLLAFFLSHVISHLSTYKTGTDNSNLFAYFLLSGDNILTGYCLRMIDARNTSRHYRVSSN